jgi:hypothetical protein
VNANSLLVGGRDLKFGVYDKGVKTLIPPDEEPRVIDEFKGKISLRGGVDSVGGFLGSFMVLPKGFTKEVFWEVVCLSVFKGDKSVAWGELKSYIGTVVESHGDLLAEDRVEDVVCLDIMCDSIEPLHVMVLDTDELFPMFEVKSPQEFVVSPIVG